MNPSSAGREAANRSTISFCRNHSAAHHLLLLCFYHNRASKPAPCSFSSLYSSRHQYLRVEDNSGRMWTTMIPTSHNIKRILNLQSIKKPNLMHRPPKRTSMAPKSLPSLSDSSHPKVHSSPAPPRPSSRSGPSLAAASPLLALHNHGHEGFKHNLVTFLYPFS